MILKFRAGWLRPALLFSFVSLLPAADLQFEVASVKPNHSGSSHSGSSGNTRTGSLTLENVTLIACISRAYNVKSWQVIAPDWLTSEHYDIGARSGRRIERDEMNQMLRTLLTERFHLAVHRETRNLRGYELVATSAPKLQPSPDDNGSHDLNSNNGHYVAHHLTMAELADALAEEIKTPVRDETGLKGAFNFTLDFSSELSAAPARTNVPDAASIFTALEQQLGLKLQAVREPFEVIVVDHADKVPTEN